MRKERVIKKKREKKRKSNENEKRKKIRKKKRKKRENTNLFIQINTQTDGQIERRKSFIDMRYYTEQYSKSNSIK